jgi:hypothetical protein
MFPGTRPWLVAAIVLSMSCHEPGPTTRTEECRDYASAFEENGTAFSCTLDQGAEVRLFCSSGLMSRSWRYASLADFVKEPSIPNRIRAIERVSSGGGLLASFSQTVRSLEYDSQGRLARRTRTGANNLGTFVLDETRYSEWDSSGRPTRGEIRAGEETADVVLQYDDPRRLLETSIGERVSRDPAGNLINEVEIFGLGAGAFRAERDYRTTATSRICLP